MSLVNENKNEIESHISPGCLVRSCSGCELSQPCPVVSFSLLSGLVLSLEGPAQATSKIRKRKPFTS